MKAKLLLSGLVAGLALFLGTAGIASAHDPHDDDCHFVYQDWHAWDDDDWKDCFDFSKQYATGACWWGYGHAYNNCPVIIVFYYVPANVYPHYVPANVYPHVLAGQYPFYMSGGQVVHSGPMYYPGYPWAGY